MRSRHKHFNRITAAATASALTVGLIAAIAASPAGARASVSPALFSRTTLEYTPSLSVPQEARRYKLIVLQSGDASAVQALHAANPKLKVLMYMSAVYASASDPSGRGTCTASAEDRSRALFLTDQRHRRIETYGQSLMNLGNRAYMNACVSHAVSVAKKDGFDGIMFTGLDAESSWLVSRGTRISQYPTVTRWDAATQAFLDYAGANVRAHHLLVMAQLTGATGRLWRRWTSPLSGSEETSWTDGGLGTAQQVPFWSEKLGDVAWSEAHHKWAIANSYNRTESGNVYGLASMLLVGDGYSAYATNNSSLGTYEGWYPQYAQAEELGAPRGAYRKLRSGVYLRRFGNGVVVVDPTTRSVRNVALGAKYWSGSHRTVSVSMGRLSGQILLSKRLVAGSTPVGSGAGGGPSGGAGSGSGGSTSGQGGSGKSGSGSTGGSGSSGASGAGSDFGASPALFNRVAYKYSSTLSTSQEANRYQFIGLYAKDAAEVPLLKAANPNLKVLMYSMALNSTPSDQNGLGMCTGYSSDDASEPNWFVHDQHGNRIVMNGYSMMDMGNTAYQQSCVTHAISEAQADGFDGILFDGLNSNWTWLVPSGVQIPEYPNSTAWEAAMQSFLDYAGKTVQAAGLMVMANMGGTDTPLWEQWTAPLTGSMEQSWTDGGQGLAQQASSFSMKLANVAWSEAHHKYAILNSWNTTEAGNTYGLAAMLLVANGYSSYSTSENTSDEYWFPEYTDARQLGSALGSYTELSSGVYERKFQNGIVVVNPNTQAVSSIPLGGTYSGATTSRTTTVSLSSLSGLVLLKAG